MAEQILVAESVAKHYPLKGAGFSRRKGRVRAVEDVSLSVTAGEVFGLVGESGCGKSTLGRALLRLEDPTAGRVFFNGANIAAFGRTRLKQFRREAQIIYQDPYSSLNPRRQIGDLIAEPLDIHRVGTPAERRERVAWLLKVVGLLPEHGRLYPHEFSGGQRQRIVIARALTLNPMLLLADEPVSALDVSIQAQVLNLLKQLQRELGLTYLFVAHNMGVVEHISDRVAVMYLGRVAELGERRALFATQEHPYTLALMSAIPVPDPTVRRTRIILKGDVPSPVNPPSGCRFHPRCPLREQLGNPAICAEAIPTLVTLDGDHQVACHFRGPGAPALPASATTATVLRPS